MYSIIVGASDCKSQLADLLVSLPLDMRIFRHIRRRQKLLLPSLYGLVITLTGMSLSAGVMLATLRAINLLGADADALACLLMVCTQWNRPPLLVAA